MKEDARLHELEQSRIRDNAILENNQTTYLKDEKCQYTSEQVEKAQKKEAHNKINDLYDNKVLNYTNVIAYMIYYVVSLLVLPFVYVGFYWIPIIVALFALIATIFVLVIVERKIRSDIDKKYEWIKYLNTFSNDSSVISYCLTSIGYVVSVFSKVVFIFVYLSMIVLFFVCLIKDIITPCKKRRCTQETV